LASPGARAQIVTSSSESDALQGTVIKCVLNVSPALCTTTTIAPVAQSVTSTTGSNEDAVPSASQSINNVQVYNISNIDDTTSDSDTASNDSGTGEARTGQVSILQGLVTFTSSDTPLTCATNSSHPGEIDCNSAQTIQGAQINGVPIPLGTYPAGTSFPVSGPINDPDCLLGTETFTGNLVFQESAIQGNGTPQGMVNQTGWRLAGTATCTVAGLVRLFTTQYDLSGNGPGYQFYSPEGELFILDYDADATGFERTHP
jgi:hypothetical protein